MYYRIDCKTIADGEALHRALAAELSFPEWYGNNLDALYDCLTELGGQTHLVLANWECVAVFAWGFHRVFTQAEQDNPGLHISFG